VTDWSDEETDNPLLAAERSFYKVEKWTKDGSRVDRMLFASSNLDKAREIFNSAIKRAAERQQDVAEVSTALRIVLLYRPLLKPLAELGQEELD
jgi:hypothetical protein